MYIRRVVKYQCSWESCFKTKATRFIRKTGRLKFWTYLPPLNLKPFKDFSLHFLIKTVTLNAVLQVSIFSGFYLRGKPHLVPFSVDCVLAAGPSFKVLAYVKSL